MREVVSGPLSRFPDVLGNGWERPNLRPRDDRSVALLAQVLGRDPGSARCGRGADDIEFWTNPALATGMLNAGVAAG
jgi:hypothetical protein